VDMTDGTPPVSSKLKKATSKDEDLMASLEMMESLAADLVPNTHGGGHSGTNPGVALKRSYTVHHKSNKPPLPKLSSPVISSPIVSNLNTPLMGSINSHYHNSDTSSTGSSHSTNGNFTTARQVLSSRISPTSSGSSPNIYPTSSPRPNRPKELFVRQITLPMDSKLETPIVPSPSLVTPPPAPFISRNNQVPPPIPARRFPRAYHQVINQHHHQPVVSTVVVSHDERSDSGVLTSPSPPTDSGIAMMSPLIRQKPQAASQILIGSERAADSASLCSSSESDHSTSSGSRYDNVIREAKTASNGVHHRYSNNENSSKTSTLVAAAAEIAAQRLAGSPTREISTQTMHHDEEADGEDGDDEDEETSDCSSDLVLESSSSEGTKKYLEDYDDVLDEDQDSEDRAQNHEEIEISDHFRRGSKFRPSANDHLKTGTPIGSSGAHFGDFALPGAILPPPSSVSSSVETPLSSSPASSPPANPAAASKRNKIAKDLEPASIKRLLAAGPTSNV